MESPRRTLSIGPLQISFRRREEGVPAGVFSSLGVHALVVSVLLLLTSRQNAQVEPERTQPKESPIPITFVNPLPPRPKQPNPRREAIASRIPPPPVSEKPLRMQPVPEITAPATSVTKDAAAKDAGRPESGTAEGLGVDPTNQVPPKIEEPKDILGRLREFREAVEKPRPRTPQPPKPIVMPNLPSIGFGVGGLQFEGRDYDWESYGRQIHGIIWRAWHNTLLSSSGVFERWAHENRRWILDQWGVVSFRILKSGQIVDVTIVTSSGCLPLDESVAEALKWAVLPPLPKDFQRDSERLQYSFSAEDFNIRLMRAGLQQMKDAGYF